MGARSMSNKEAIAALATAQSQMKTPHKDAVNPHYGNRYASLKSCINAIKPALNKNGFALIQSAGRDDLGDFIETAFEHTSGGLFKSKFYLSPDKKGMQGMGSAATYAKRYGLLGLAGVEPDEETDDDATAAKVDEEQEHDDAVRSERNEGSTETSQKDLEILAERIKEKIKDAKQTWQLKKIPEEFVQEFEAIQKGSGNLAQEIMAYHKTRWEQLNDGIRR